MSSAAELQRGFDAVVATNEQRTTVIHRTEEGELRNLRGELAARGAQLLERPHARTPLAVVNVLWGTV